MKILILNLLRLGDVIAMAPAVKAIRVKYPQAEIHVVVNSNFVDAAKLIRGVDRTICFERDRLQGACVEADRPMFEAYDWLQGFVEETSAVGYDLLFNFTHNRLSGWLSGLIEAKQKIGLVLDGSGAVSFGSAWFRHLNQQVDFDDEQAFNHTDIFIGAAGGCEPASLPYFFDDLLVETESGRTEATELLKEAKTTKIVAFQVSTSDSKKEWGDAKFRALAEILLRRDPDLTIFVLGAPTERARIEELCRSSEVDPERLRPAVLALAGVISFLEEVDVLLTGDTSIKHFASAGTARVVELILGSADSHRTGSWKSEDIVIASRELCAPCGHSEPCHRNTHACALSVSPESVAQTLLPILFGESHPQRHARVRLLKDIQVFEVDRSEGPVNLVPLSDAGLSDAALALSLERSARRISLEIRDSRFDKSKFGSEILRTKAALMVRFRDVRPSELRHALSDGEARLRHAEGIVQSLKIQLSRLKESIQDPKRMAEMVSSAIVMRSRLQKNPWTRFVAEPLVQVIEDDRSAPFVRFRKLSDSVLDLELRIEIGLKLVRGLECEFENEIDTASEFKSSMGDQR